MSGHVKSIVLHLTRLALIDAWPVEYRFTKLPPVLAAPIFTLSDRARDNGKCGCFFCRFGLPAPSTRTRRIIYQPPLNLASLSTLQKHGEILNHKRK